MPEISKINSVAIGSIGKIFGIAKSSMGKFMGISAPASFTWSDTKSLEFDGSDDYVAIEDFEFTNENISISWWCTRDALSHNKTILQALNNFTSDDYYKGLIIQTQQNVGWKWYFGEQAGGNYWGTNTGDIGFTSVGAPKYSGWHHFVFTIGEGPTTPYKGPPMVLYMDGYPVFTQAASISESASIIGSAVAIKLRVGMKKGGSGTNWLGTINDLAFFNTVLTAANVKAMWNRGDPTDLTEDAGNYNASSNLTGYWLFGDSDTYPTVTDRSGNGNDGTMTNMTSGDIVTDAPDSAFRFTVNTENAGSATKTFVLPLVNDGTINFTVDWGDSSSDTITSYNDSETTHVYSSTGTYTIKMIGTIRGWDFANGGDKLKIINIEQWGDFNITQQGIFMGCANLTSNATDAPIISTTDLTQTFNQCAALNGGLRGWDVSSVTNMYSMFYGCTVLDADLSSWDVGEVTNMYQMFQSANAFNNDSLADWDVSKLENMSYMFSCTAFNGNISNWDTGEVTDMSSVFRSPSTFNQDISGWDTSKVENTSYMFYWNTSYNQDMSRWDTGAVTNMTNMFRYTTAFNQNIGAWDIEAVTAFGNFMQGDTLSTANYDALLTGWADQNAQDELTLHFGSSQYTGGEEGAGGIARQDLIDVDGWSITDGGASEGEGGGEGGD